MSVECNDSGPVVWITACVHGDEVGGIAIVQEVFNVLQQKLLRGTVNAFPLLNPIGFENGSRYVTVSQEDLNRSFPGDAKGSPGQRMANIILNRMLDTFPDLVIDLHNDWVKSIPYVVLDRNPPEAHKAAFLKTRTHAKNAGLVAVDDADVMPGSLSYNLLDNGIPALTFEMGEPRTINERNVDYGVKAILNILAEMEMVPRPEIPFQFPIPKDYDPDWILRYSDKPYISQSGIVRVTVKPGDRVRKGQRIARITDIFGRPLETLRAQDDAIVLGYTDSAVGFAGMPIAAFGVRG